MSTPEAVATPTLKQMAAFLRERGGDDVEHTGGNYVGHCASVYRDMKTWGYSEELAIVGFFHSVYGTGIFQRFKLELDQRPAVRELIGERAEWLCFLNCSIDYDEFDRLVKQQRGPYRMTSRLTGETLEVSDRDFEDLVAVHLVDRLEQVPRSEAFDWRRDAFRRMAERVGPEAVARFEAVYPAA